MWTLGSACETTLVRWWQLMKPANRSVLQAGNYQISSYSDSFYERDMYSTNMKHRGHTQLVCFLSIWHTTNTLVFIPSVCNTGISPYLFIFWKLDTQVTYYIVQFLTHITQRYHIILIRIMSLWNTGNPPYFCKFGTKWTQHTYLYSVSLTHK